MTLINVPDNQTSQNNKPQNHYFAVSSISSVLRQ